MKNKLEVILSAVLSFNNIYFFKDNNPYNQYFVKDKFEMRLPLEKKRWIAYSKFNENWLFSD